MIKLKIGTRGSRLAMWQANEVQRLLPVETTIRVVKTSGDRDRTSVLQGQSTTGFFTREIEQLLLAGEVDLAVHSLKDLPTQVARGLEINAYLERAPFSDLILLRPESYVDQGEDRLPLKPGAIVGAGSLRRQSLLKRYAVDSVPTMIRGNVPTRIQKCLHGEYDAVVLARAGVQRIEADTGNLVVLELNPSVWLPAPGQAVVAVETRIDDGETRKIVQKINHIESGTAVAIERKLLANFEGGCHTAFGALARGTGDKWTVNAGMDFDGEWRVYNKSGTVQELMNTPVEVLSEFKTPVVPTEEIWWPLNR